MTNDSRGLFISFEGTEGCGKTTQMRLLVERLRREGYHVTENQEPGGTPIGKQIRRVLLDPINDAMAPMTELLMMFASRTQAAAEVIRPALKRGDIVVSDRFTDSTLAYQGHARGLGIQTVLAAHELALGSLWPDLTVAIELPVEVGLARAHQRNSADGAGDSEARLDEESLAFHRKVAEGYGTIAQSEPKRFHVLDGSGAVPDLAESIWKLAEAKLKK